jgi:hypothetical protein
MKARTLLTLLLPVAALTASAKVDINLPIVSTKYTADPAPYVHNDTIYLYTTHDEPDGENFHMKDWLLYTSTDMVNWHDRGIVASLKDFKWYTGDNGAWAEQVIERNGKWYMYCPIHGHGIGVLVSDSPYGPFTDPLGKPLVWNPENWDDIDPTVWIDDDGRTYMYWGNPHTYCIELNEDMISVKGERMVMEPIEDYQEGPWFWKRGGHYYLAYASTCCPEGIGYAMSASPTGPWNYMGHIMNHTPRTRGNHPGIINDYKGHSYVFGLTYDLFRFETGRHAERRSVMAAEMHYRSDGSIEEVPYFQDCTLRQIESFDPYRKVEAETMAWGRGLQTERLNPWGGERWNQRVTSIDQDEFILVKGVDFKNGASTFTASAYCHMLGGSIEVRLDDIEGTCIGTLLVTNTRDEWREFRTKVKKVSGIHDLYLVFRGNKWQQQNLFDLDYWKFEK